MKEAEVIALLVKLLEEYIKHCEPNTFWGVDGERRWLNEEPGILGFNEWLKARASNG